MEDKGQKKSKQQKKKNKQKAQKEKERAAQAQAPIQQLNLQAATFVPSFLAGGSSASFQPSQSQPQQSSTLNVNAMAFVPKPKPPGDQATVQEQPLATPLNFGAFNPASFGPQGMKPELMGRDPMIGYKNMYLPKGSHQMTQMMQKKALTKQQELQKKVYSLEFMLSLRNANADRPVNMTLLDFPHKHRKTKFRQQASAIDKFNLVVKELRILLNKLSKGNFEVISKQILQEYSFTPSLLNELTKIIFVKATTEETYLELYVKLCILLFKKYNDKENKEMNFKKLLLNKCQKQFYKMKEAQSKPADPNEEMHSSQERPDLQQTRETNQESDFNKQMLFVYDQIEIEYRQKKILHGNMKLIVELFINHQIPEGIIQTCLESLFEDINDQSVEILCQMLDKLVRFIIQATINREKREREKKIEKSSSASNYQINLQYLDKLLQRLFAYRKGESISSRVRFKIQDLMDEYSKEWKKIILGEQLIIDEVGFQYKYIPKDSIVYDECFQKKGGGIGSSEKSKKHSKDLGKNQYVYVRKTPLQSFDQQEQNPPSDSKKAKPVDPSSFKSPMQKLLQNLQPSDLLGTDDNEEESHSEEDETLQRLVERKVSMNEQNVIGNNFMKYTDQKPSQQIRRKILNFLEEYREGVLDLRNLEVQEVQEAQESQEALGQRCMVKEAFEEICRETEIQKFVFIGYILNFGFSLDQRGWNDIFELVIEKLTKQYQIVSQEELLEGVHFSLANFLDTLIDYPNSLGYSMQVFEKLQELGILNQVSLSKYKQHVNQLNASKDEI